MKLHRISFQTQYSVSVGNFFEVRFHLIMLCPGHFLIKTEKEGPLKIVVPWIHDIDAICIFTLIFQISAEYIRTSKITQRNNAGLIIAATKSPASTVT